MTLSHQDLADLDACVALVRALEAARVRLSVAYGLLSLLQQHLDAHMSVANATLDPRYLPRLDDASTLTPAQSRVLTAGVTDLECQLRDALALFEARPLCVDCGHRLLTRPSIVAADARVRCPDCGRVAAARRAANDDA